MQAPRFDPHLHAAPSSRPRWGDELELVDAATRAGIEGFVLKSHHESTASRAAVASRYAQSHGINCQAIGSIVLNPWTSMIELERALNLGARVVWWPTLDNEGSFGPHGLPPIHEQALAAIEERTNVTVATGHLNAGCARELVEAAVAVGTEVVVTHPLNPDVGCGIAAAHAMSESGALVEIDARSMQLLRDRGVEPAPLVRELVDGARRVFASSDGGQPENGMPFSFLSRELSGLRKAGAQEAVSRLIDGSNMWVRTMSNA
jgi:hypothetical protein